MRKVLIIDDAAFMRMSLRMMVEKYGYRVVGEAETGKAGVRKFRELSPDIVMMDIAMPDMDGITALKEIRKINAEAKVVMCTTMGQDVVIRDAILAGAKGFVIKPFTAELVVKTLANL